MWFFSVNEPHVPICSNEAAEPMVCIWNCISTHAGPEVHQCCHSNCRQLCTSINLQAVLDLGLVT